MGIQVAVEMGLKKVPFPRSLVFTWHVPRLADVYVPVL